MSVAPTVCPACHSALAPSDSICPICGRVLATLPGGQTLAPVAPGPLPPIAPGRRLGGGRFTVQRRVGQGGMGTLFLASDHSAFDRPVILKVLLAPGDPAEAREARERFIAEARMLATLKYPTIPQIFAHFEEHSQACIVMEYVEGRDLLQGLTNIADDGSVRPGAAYPLADVLRWGIDLCRKLEYLAGQQPPVVHQDIKPANLMLDRHSQDLFLVDFGTVRSGSAGKVTAFGTPGYAPPEQYQGRGEPKSDVYALAATLYHLASDDDPGQHPFRFPRLAALGPLGAALTPALARDPAARPDAATLRRSLEALLTTDQQAANTRPAAAARQGLLPPLTAPDGATVRSPVELAAWCERNWDQALAWFNQGLASAISTSWSDEALARELRTVFTRHERRDAALDQALALLDPDGYGATVPQIVADQQLDFGVVSGRERRWLVLRNQGRRYGEVQIRGRGPLLVDKGVVGVLPGQQADVAIYAELGHYPPGQQVRAELLLSVDGQQLPAVAALAESGKAPPWYVQASDTSWWIAGMVVLTVLLLVVLFTIGQP